jgi:hypothetical protein
MHELFSQVMSSLDDSIMKELEREIEKLVE